MDIKGFLILAALVALLSKSAQAKGKRSKKMKDFKEADFQKAIQEVKRIYGQSVAEYVEKIYRLETAHFKSVQFKKTGSPGMEAAKGKDSFPWGWKTPLNIWMMPQHRPEGLFEMPENKTGIIKKFIIFPTVTAAALSLAEYIKHYGTPGRWYSTDPAKQQIYIQKLEQIRTRYV